MNYKKLGNTDLDVSTICLGTMTWGEQNTEEEGFEQMDWALDHGVNFWDTAEIYSIPMRKETYGETERIIGNWFKKTNKRDKVVIATKVCGNTSNKYIRGGGNNFGKKKISDALEESKNKVSFPLPVGSTIFSNNYFWLHGRKAFKEHSGLSRELLRIRGTFFH